MIVMILCIESCHTILHYKRWRLHIILVIDTWSMLRLSLFDDAWSSWYWSMMPAIHAIDIATCFTWHRSNDVLYICYQSITAYNRFGIHPCYVHCIRLHHILLITSCCIACMSSTLAMFPIRVMHTSTWWIMFTSLWYGPMIHNTSTCHWCMMQALLPLIDVYSVIDITQYMIYKMQIVHTVNYYFMVHLSSIYGTCQRWYCILRMLSINNA